jgi:DNA-binding transcriptional LysR family regulator
MSDLNLLVTLNVLLEEGSVARAARRLQLSPSAMSRSLSRLRDTTGDPLLVRAGRKLVPSPRALELRAQVGDVVRDAEAILRPVSGLKVAELARTFTLRCSDGFVESYGTALVARARREAPHVRLHFIQRTDRDSSQLREGSVDLEIGVVSRSTGPEVLSQTLFRDRFVGVVRARHPLVRGRMSTQRYTAGEHILVLRGPGRSPVDVALDALGLERSFNVTVESFAAALALARGSDLIATVPESHTSGLRAGMHHFALPFRVPEITISLLWHPRMDGDLAHRWLRLCVREVCASKP